MTIVAVYAILQFAFEIGYTKGNYASYIQSTFHENEGFATFSFMAFVIAFPLFFLRESKWSKALYGVSCLPFLTAILLSNSRAVMILVPMALFFFLLAAWFKDRSIFHRKKVEISTVLISIPLIVALIAAFSPYTWKKITRLTNDIELLNEQSVEEQKAIDRENLAAAREKGGSLTLVARMKLWRSAASMLTDSWGAGMGAGAYYRLTGFPRYQAISKMENAHMFWLQLMAELGVFMLIVVLGFLIIPLYLGWSENASGSQRWLAIALFAYWFCNIVGQSLTQNEILWLFALMAGIAFRGAILNRPTMFTELFMTRKIAVASLAILLGLQTTVWAINAQIPLELGFQKIHSESYGHAFDEMGHRYQQVGSAVTETHYVPHDDTVLEFRVRAASPDVTLDNPLRIKALLLDPYNRIISTASVDLTGSQNIQSVYLPIKDMANQSATTILTVDQVEWRGNLLKSDERQLVGFHYYGSRWASEHH